MKQTNLQLGFVLLSPKRWGITKALFNIRQSF